MGRATATTTTTQEVRIAPTVRRKILTQLNGYATVHEEMKALKGSKEGHSKAVFLLADANIDAKNFEIEGFKVSMQRDAKDSRLNKDALLDRLVADGKYSLKAAQALLKDCTKETPKKPHVRITPPGGKDEDE